MTVTLKTGPEAPLARVRAREGLRVLSVRQPWASLIASGRKTVELRSWSTKYRGPLVIVSGVTPWRGEHGFELGPRGVAICTVELVDVRVATPADTEAACIVPPDGFGFSWELARPRVVRNVPVKGKLGLYAADAALLEAIA